MTDIPDLSDPAERARVLALEIPDDRATESIRIGGHFERVKTLHRSKLSAEMFAIASNLKSLALWQDAELARVTAEREALAAENAWLIARAALNTDRAQVAAISEKEGR